MGVDAPRAVRKRLTDADVSRIAEMHSSLLQGGEAAQGVLQLLAGQVEDSKGEGGFRSIIRKSQDMTRSALTLSRKTLMCSSC